MTISKEEHIYTFACEDLGCFNSPVVSLKVQQLIKNKIALSMKQKENSEALQKEVIQIMENHILRVGEKQAVKDFQRGISVLNKKSKKFAQEKTIALKLDGDWGEKTLKAFRNVWKNYSPMTVAKYIELGAMNNIIFDTKDNPKIDIEKKIENICEPLKLKGGLNG